MALLQLLHQRVHALGVVAAAAGPIEGAAPDKILHFLPVF